MICEHSNDYQTCSSSKRTLICPCKTFFDDGDNPIIVCGQYLKLHPEIKEKLKCI